MAELLKISGDLSAIEKFAKLLEPKRLRQYASTAVNETVRQVKTRTIVEIVNHSSIPRQHVASGVAISSYSSPETLKATIAGSGRPISLKYFNPVQTSSGVDATVWGKAQHYPHAFIVQSLGGHVFKREGPSRLPIKKMWGAGIAQVMVEREVKQVLATFGRERLAINTQRQMQRALYAQGNG